MLIISGGQVKWRRWKWCCDQFWLARWSLMETLQLFQTSADPAPSACPEERVTLSPARCAVCLRSEGLSCLGGAQAG